MPQVDFYVLDQSVPNGKLRCACRVAQKIYSLGHTIFIHTQNQEQSALLDDLLWTFNQNSFIPHDRVHELETNVESPVIIGNQAPTKAHHNVLISLLDNVPSYFDQYGRIAELVDNTPEDKASARTRFRAYRDQGWSLQTHNFRV